MGLRDRLKRTKTDVIEDLQAQLFREYGVVENPFPPASQPFGHSRLEDEADERIAQVVQNFERDNTSQVVVVEGRQGVGKTNILSYYEKELRDLYKDQLGFYVIRYYPDPEPTFDGILRKVFQELGQQHLRRLSEALSKQSGSDLEALLALCRTYEFRSVLRRLCAAVETPDWTVLADATMEWLVGLRLLNRHRDLLGVQFRLNTIESKNQALRDLVECSVRLGQLKGIFLLLDELEKQDDSRSKLTVLRYLSAIRALIDALPQNLFLMAAITTVAKDRYFSMLPALAGRMQNIVPLKPLQSVEEALRLYQHYLREARERASRDFGEGPEGQYREPVSAVDLATLFNGLVAASADKGVKGVTHRDFLHSLHISVERLFQTNSAADTGQP